MPDTLWRIWANGPDHDDAALAAFVMAELTSTPQAIAAIGQEISDVFECCALTSETSFVADPTLRRNDEFLMCCITKIHDVLTQRVQNNSGAGQQHSYANVRVLLKQYQDAITTPLNLKMLFYMCDARTRTGEIRCRAIGLLMMISSDMLYPSATLWSMKIPTHDPFEPIVSFAIQAIAAMAKVLTQKGCCQYPQGQCPSECCGSPWIIMVNATRNVLKTEEHLDGILLELYECTDWPTLLQDDDDTYRKVREHSGKKKFCDVQTFIHLHVWACEVLEKDPSNATVKTFLRKKLGSCHELFRKCLRRIITGKIHASSSSSSSSSSTDATRCLLDALHVFGDFLGKFIHCLAHLPNDRESKALVRRARMTLIETIVVKILMPNGNLLRVDANMRRQIHSRDRFALCHLSTWQELNSVRESSDSARWTRFKFTMLDGPIMTSDESLVARLRKEHENAQSDRTNNIQNGTCANCFVSETAFRQECSENLMSCSRCRQVLYCSKVCQREHWQGHKKQCKMVGKGKAEKSEWNLRSHDQTHSLQYLLTNDDCFIIAQRI